MTRPAGEPPGRAWPGVLAYSDISQLMPPHVRVCQRLAGYGFAVVAPEIFARLEPPGTALDFDRDRQRALDDAGIAAHVRLYEAEHAFMWDEGPRFDLEAADRAFADMLALFGPLRDRR